MTLCVVPFQYGLALVPCPRKLKVAKTKGRVESEEQPKPLEVQTQLPLRIQDSDRTEYVAQVSREPPLSHVLCYLSPTLPLFIPPSPEVAFSTLYISLHAYNPQFSHRNTNSSTVHIQIKILKRQPDHRTSEVGAAVGSSTGSPSQKTHKSLAEREADYASARYLPTSTTVGCKAWEKELISVLGVSQRRLGKGFMLSCCGSPIPASLWVFRKPLYITLFMGFFSRHADWCYLLLYHLARLQPSSCSCLG